MLRKRFNFNDLFSEFDSLFGSMNSFNPQMIVRGEKNVESGEDENGTWTKETFTSEDGTYQYTSIYRFNGKGNTKDNSEITQLKQQLNSCIEKQDYETAAELRDKIKTIEGNEEAIKDLQSKLDDAIEKQDFEKAIKLRDKLKKLKS